MNGRRLPAMLPAPSKLALDDQHVRRQVHVAAIERSAERRARLLGEDYGRQICEAAVDILVGREGEDAVRLLLEEAAGEISEKFRAGTETAALVEDILTWSDHRRERGEG